MKRAGKDIKRGQEEEQKKSILKLAERVIEGKEKGLSNLQPRHRKAYHPKDRFRHSMSNLNVAILGAADYGKELGKKGTVSDLTFYNLKKGESTVTLIEPSRYPERIAPLFYAIS
ncbi:MAG TPA: hypothetical protein PKZ03_09220, partial [Methanothrix sp.]|nr:hypothetical protein [Methanothrix sp.]